VTYSPAGPPLLGIHLPAYAQEDPGDWSHLLDCARAADLTGVDRIVVTDHVVYGNNQQAYARPELGGKAGGRQPTGPDGHWLEPMTVLSVACGLTSRVRLGTTILLAALRRPVVLAKAAATLDVLSGGRLDLGVGVGWQREEYEAAGLDFRARGGLLDESLAIMQSLWRDNPACYHSARVSFDEIHCMPKPAQPGGVPIWVSGTLNPRVMNRITRHGSGWIPWGPWLDDPAPGIPVVRRALTAAGRDPAEFRIMATLAPVVNDNGLDIAATLERVGPLAQAGVTDFRVKLPVPAALDDARDFLSQVVDRFRFVSGRGAAPPAPGRPSDSLTLPAAWSP
jgi:probable F420-dependent oxidoreductase